MPPRAKKSRRRSVSLDEPFSVDAYFDELARWLELEAVAERERMARRRQNRSRADVEKTGETLVRMLLDFTKPGGEPLPMNRLKVGSPVVVSNDADPADNGVPGVVSRRKHNVIQVATDAWPDAHTYRLDLSPDETTRRRQLAAMAQARQASGRSGRLREMLLGSRPLRYQEPQPIEFFSHLNPPQQDAVRFALAADDVAILHGPPGTGKTTTLAEVIYQAVQQGDRVLACAPSNTAVDNLLERLVAMMPNVLRVGHPARVFEALRGHTLDELVDTDPAGEVIRDMRREVEQLVRAASKDFRGRDGQHRRRELFAEAGQ